MKLLYLFLAMLTACLPASLAAQDNSGTPIRMGVREDVPPFVWRDPLSDEFRGFFWDICTAALVRAGYSFEEVPINATQRAELLNTGSYCSYLFEEGQSCKEVAIQTVDLLCDPTTITLERMRVFALGKKRGEEQPERDPDPLPADGPRPFVFSPVLYLANGSYIKQTFSRSDFREGLAKKLTSKCSADGQTGADEQIRAVFCPVQSEAKALSWLVPPAARASPEPAKFEWPAACDAIISALNQEVDVVSVNPDRDEPKAWPPQIWPEPKPKKPQFEIWGYVKGATIEPAIREASKRAPSSVAICPQAFLSHTEATNAFCSGSIYRYFGDVDLVRARVEAFRMANDQKCPADETPSAQGTYEPYALVLSHARNELPEVFNLALYSMFSDGTITQFFEGRFGKGRQSQYLETLFRINSIPSGRLFVED